MLRRPENKGESRRMWKFSIVALPQCCSPLVVPVVKGVVGHCRYPLFLNFSFFSLFSHCDLYHKSPTPIFCCYSSFSSRSFQISFNAVLPSHSRSSSLPFPSTFWASDLLAILPTYSFQPTPLKFLLKTFLHSNLHLSSSILLSSALFTPTILLIQLFSQTCAFSCCFSVSAIVPKSDMYAGVTHEVNTFPLSLRDVRLSSITSSTFRQPLPPAVIPMRILVSELPSSHIAPPR